MQGDVIRRTDEIELILQEYYPHHKGRVDYRYFMVLTQTCDLVPRSGGDSGNICKARYISLAAVRPFSIVFKREIAKFQHDPMDERHGICDEKNRGRIRNFIERILNNNEPEYFYLHEEPAAGLSEPHCAFLALSIPVKSLPHYDKLLKAKILQLDDSFQHKLGWLTGNLFSRIGTADWVPEVCTKEKFDEHLEELLNEYCLWVNPAHQKQLREALAQQDSNSVTTDQIAMIYDDIKRTAPSKKQQLLDKITDIMRSEGIDDATRKRISILIRSDQDIPNWVKK
ncbi:hypothetical protein [Geothrix mesophila]|uniref:hypothetical protein n=1 Tax=Geothrix mesophila TaxID=2922723 RepID=UPI001FAC38CE|nr:hypothetical protein [Geothrix sp. SG198]